MIAWVVTKKRADASQHIHFWSHHLRQGMSTDKCCLCWCLHQSFFSWEKFGNDKNNPLYDKFQIIQSKNDYATVSNWFDADLLKTKFDEDRIWVAAAAEDESSLSVMVANTQEQQEALAKATTHGKKFFVTSGEHITSNDMFIAANGEREITEMKQNKKYVLSSAQGMMPLLLSLTTSITSQMEKLRN